jgi:hypothetical protein
MTAYQLQLFHLSTNMTANHIPSVGGSVQETAEISVSVLFRHLPRPVFFRQWSAKHSRPLVGEEN